MNNNNNYANKWWHHASIYQIYIKSFYDTKGSGEGTINGITAKLDYLKMLGVGGIWICPIFESPDVDNGYDISDYLKIQSKYGSEDDVKNMISEAHKRDIKIIMDLVANHSSDQHLWFIKSKNKEEPYKDYYIWAKNEGKVPSNWGSFFGGGVWTLDKTRNEYYMHLFTKEQPDLNWRNHKLRDEIYKIMEYWMNLGVDGWRLDAISHIAKPEFPIDYKDAKQKYIVGDMHGNGPNIHEYFQEMNKRVLSKYKNAIAIGEANLIPIEEAHLFVDQKRKELDMMFTFEHMDCDRKHTEERGGYNHGEFNFIRFKKILAKWQAQLYERGWNALYLNNHDQPRAVSRFSDDKTYRVESAKMLALMTHMMQGTPFIYQGEEIGMTNTNLVFEELDDVSTKQSYKYLVEEAKVMSKEEFISIMNRYCREHARTPMQWDASKNAGFSVNKPWIAINNNYKEINVELALADKNSVFYFYQKLNDLRKKDGQIKDVITYGNFELLLAEDANIFAYKRNLGNNFILVLNNFSAKEVLVDLDFNLHEYKIDYILGNYNVKSFQNKYVMQPYEGTAYIFKKN